MSLPLAPLERIMRNAGAERVSEDAVEAMRDAVEDLAGDIANNAVRAAIHAKRKTVKKEDIDLVAR